MLNSDNSGQVSAELILILAGIIMIVIIATTIYKNYVTDLTDEIKNNEVSDLKNKIDKINNLIE